jgi:hypothetical protein
MIFLLSFQAHRAALCAPFQSDKVPTAIGKSAIGHAAGAGTSRHAGLR